MEEGSTNTSSGLRRRSLGDARPAELGSLGRHDPHASPEWSHRRVASAAFGAMSDPTFIPELLVQAAGSVELQAASSAQPQSSHGSHGHRLSHAARLVQNTVHLHHVGQKLHEKHMTEGGVNTTEAEEEEEEEEEEHRILTLDDSQPAAACTEDLAIARTAQLKAAALVGFDAVSSRLLRHTWQYPVTFLVLQARLHLRQSCWPGPFALVRRLTPVGLYRGFAPLALSVSLGELAARAPALLEYTTASDSEGHEDAGYIDQLFQSIPYRLAVLLPQLWLESLWARLVSLDTACAAAIATTSDTSMWSVVRTMLQEVPLFSFSSSKVLGVPLWLLAWQLTHGRRIATCGTAPPWSYFTRLLPPAHPSHESRSWRESLRATPYSAIPMAILHGMPQPDHQGHLLACLRCVLPGLAVGAIGWLCAKTAFQRLRGWLLRRLDFEKPAQRLTRKLALAQRYAPHVRARLQIETRSLLRDAPRRRSSFSPRATLAAFHALSSFQAKTAAARGLQPKRDRLIARLKAHAKRARAAQAPEMQGVVPCLQVRRQSISSSLRFVSHLPAVALELGQLRIKFIDEPAVDAGGVFREFMGEMARTLLESPLLAAANDGGLLPVHGQAALERRARAHSTTMDLVVPLGKDGKLGCMLGVCATCTSSWSAMDSPRGRTHGGASQGEGANQSDGSVSPGFSVLQVQQDYPAAALLRPGDDLVAVNGSPVDCANVDQALSLIRQAAMDGAPRTITVSGAGFEKANGTYTRLDDVVRGGGAPVYAKDAYWIARYLVRYSGPMGKRQAYVWFLQLANDGGDIYQVAKPFAASFPPCDEWVPAPHAHEQFGEVSPAPTLEADDVCAVMLTVKRGKEPFNPAWREEIYAIGRLMAIAIATNTPLNIPLSRSIYKLLLAEPITAYDVARIDKDFARHRVAPLLRSGGVAHMEKMLGGELYFTGVPLQSSGEEQELLPGGASRRVTEANKEMYVSLLIEHYLVGHCREELAILTAGFHDLIPHSVLRDDVHTVDGLHALELELIIAGLPSIDVIDWRKHTKWSSTGVAKNGDEESIQKKLEGWLFEVLERWSSDERATVLSFVCGSGRLPAAGFAGLRPQFNVEINHSEATEHLPSAHTCFNQLCIPAYTSMEQLKEKLASAIRLGANSFGFM
ncbi:hypothetical protein AB1Y20_023132 [Prymnesium parvum]|uniref:HECT-type E3 ubiquitin transferase n=1 Tax=Prymnesium parvum TaxID=97485 RepID=A0AB34JD77_PRYPA